MVKLISVPEIAYVLMGANRSSCQGCFYKGPKGSYHYNYSTHNTTGCVNKNGSSEQSARSCCKDKTIYIPDTKEGMNEYVAHKVRNRIGIKPDEK